LFSFLALFAALFSIKVLSGFFLFCFLLSLPLLMLAAPSGLDRAAGETRHFLSIFAASIACTPFINDYKLLQQFLNFFPLPHGQGSLRLTFFSAIVGFGGFNNRSRSLTSSGFSGSNPIRYCQPCFSNVDVTSLNRASDWTLTTAGFFPVPNLAVFLAENIFILFSASTLLLIVPTLEILFPIASLFQLLSDLAIAMRSPVRRNRCSLPLPVDNLSNRLLLDSSPVPS
jgi:hypothetical protein